MGSDILPQPGIHEFPGTPRLMGSCNHLWLRRTGRIGTASDRVADIFSAQCAGGSAQDSRHRSPRITLGQSQAQRVTFLDAEVL